MILIRLTIIIKVNKDCAVFKLYDSPSHVVIISSVFWSGVAPFSGATTGTGGRIRDVQSAGKGGHVIAGTAGYCFGNLHIPGKL